MAEVNLRHPTGEDLLRDAETDLAICQNVTDPWVRAALTAWIRRAEAGLRQAALWKLRSLTCCFCHEAFPDVATLRRHSDQCQAHPLYATREAARQERNTLRKALEGLFLAVLSHTDPKNPPDPRQRANLERAITFAREAMEADNTQ